MSKSTAENTLAKQLRGHGIEFKREYRFHPRRRWRADFFIPARLLVEVEGIGYTPGRATRHQFGRGYEEDCIKYNEAALHGYIVMRFTPDMVNGKGRGNRKTPVSPAIDKILEYIDRHE